MCHPFIFFRFILKKDVLWLPSSAKTPVVCVGLLSLHLGVLVGDGHVEGAETLNLHLLRLEELLDEAVAIDNLTHNQSCFILC